MIKAISLIFDPAVTWDKIVLNQKSFRQVLFFFLVPLILISVGGEMTGVVLLGKPGIDESLTEARVKLPTKRVIGYGVAELAFSFAVVFMGAKMVKAVADTFQNRTSYEKSFIVVAYTLSPLFLVRLCDAFPDMNPWASFGIGMVLCILTLYYGVPRVLQPDPPNAFGLYVMGAILLTGTAGFARFLTLLLLAGKIKYL